MDHHFAIPRVAVPQTPALVIHLPVVRQNLKKLADYASHHEINLRPHTKTHKSLEIAQLQLESGCYGLTVAKAGEAEVMSKVCSDILVAYPAVDPARCQLLGELAKQVAIRVAVDSEYGILKLAESARRNGSEIGILVDQNVGSDRTGVSNSQEALKLAQLVETTPGVRLDGLFFYPGQVWESADQQATPLKKIDAILQETIELWAKSGLQASIVSGGSTPTAYQSHLLTSQTEIRPGTYPYNDMNTVRAGFCELEECAAAFICTVVSNAVSGKAVIDAGSKTLTSDRNVKFPDSGHGYVLEYPEAKISRLSEEHGELDLSNSSKVPKLGERVTVIPNHICPCVNLQDQVYTFDDHNTIGLLKTDARGKLT